LWPDFGRTELLEAIIDYQRRERRFGGITRTAASHIEEDPLLLEEIEVPLR
jgi:Putative undecaprenyl diphosphate synthase